MQMALISIKSGFLVADLTFVVFAGYILIASHCRLAADRPNANYDARHNYFWLLGFG